MMIDNGNHLLLSGNRAALAYLRRIGARGPAERARHGRFPFVDLADRRALDAALQRRPLPVVDLRSGRGACRARSALDYLPLARLLWAPAEQADRRGDAIAAGRSTSGCCGRCCSPRSTSSRRRARRSSRGAVIRETLARGGQACRPLIARDGLGDAFVEPALRYLQRARRRGRVRPAAAWRCASPDARVAALDFGDATVRARPATTPSSSRCRRMSRRRSCPASRRRPSSAPSSTRISASIRRRHRRRCSACVNGTVEWIFAFPAGSRSPSAPPTGCSTRRARSSPRTIWREVAAICRHCRPTLPPWQIVRERRATFAATPEQNALRPGARTRWHNLFLAGDWTATGLPATIEGAIRSGNRAADLGRRNA